MIINCNGVKGKLFIALCKNVSIAVHYFNLDIGKESIIAVAKGGCVPLLRA